MYNYLFRKILIFGIIILLVGAGTISSTASLISKKNCLNNIKSSLLDLSDDRTVVFVKGWLEKPDPQVNIWNNIQDGIANVSEGGTVFVYNWTYFGRINITKSLSLIGEDKENTIIDFEQKTMESGDGYIAVWANNVNITGFTIRNGYVRKYKDVGPKTFLIKTEVNVRNCKICGNILDYCDTGIYLSDGNRNCNIHENVIKNFGYYGIKVDQLMHEPSNNNCIYSNKIFKENEIKVGGVGIQVESLSFKNSVVRNLIYGNMKYGVVIAEGARVNLIAFNRIKDCFENGILMHESGDSNSVVGNDLIDIGSWPAFFCETGVSFTSTTHWAFNYYDGPPDTGQMKKIYGQCGRTVEGFRFDAIDFDLHAVKDPIFDDTDFS